MCLPGVSSDPRAVCRYAMSLRYASRWRQYSGVAGAGFAVERSETFEPAQQARLPATFLMMNRIPPRVWRWGVEWQGRDSNPRPRAYESPALTN